MKTKAAKPRNPMIPALCLRSGGGVHQKSTKAMRQHARQWLVRCLKKGEGDFVEHVAVAC